MPVESVILTDEALSGIVVNEVQRRAVAALPQTVKLGRKRPAARPQCLALSRYAKSLQIVPLPASVDYYTKAAASIARMYLNDTYGDCVIAGKGHALGVWSTGDADSGPVVLATDNEIHSQYQSVCGPGDNGCYIPDVLDYMVSKGFTAGGQKYKLDGYVAVDWTSKELVQTAIAVFGALCIGINLPNAWTSAAVWDVTNTGIVGGHDVTPCGYGTLTAVSANADGVVIASWGRLYLITWAAFTSTKWLEECYVMVPSVLWTGADGRSPLGLDLAGLKDDMAKLSQGTIPPLPDPTPVPPVPPTPPSPPVPPGPPVPPSPPVPPIQPVAVTGATQPTTVSFTVPTGVFGRPITTSITIPSLPVTGTTVPGTAGRAGFNFGPIVALLAKYGSIALPIILADLAAGKSWSQIVADLEAAFGI